MSTDNQLQVKPQCCYIRSGSCLASFQQQLRLPSEDRPLYPVERGMYARMFKQKACSLYICRFVCLFQVFSNMYGQCSRRLGRERHSTIYSIWTKQKACSLYMCRKRNVWSLYICRNRKVWRSIIRASSSAS